MNPPKRMLEVNEQVINGLSTKVVKINYSSLNLMQTCFRKAHYLLNLNYRDEVESEALIFGKAIHKALEHWYSLPVTNRQLDDLQAKRAKLWEAGNQEGLEVPTTGALESIRLFCVEAGPIALKVDQDKRSISSGVKILIAYFKQYFDDMLEVVSDEHGPLIERSFEFLLHSEPGLHIYWHGTVDVVLRNKELGSVFVADHKTTAALGKDFFNRLNPNFQYTGYIMAAQHCFGLQTDTFMVNGIQVAKTKQEFSRQFTSRTPDDYEELRTSVLNIVKRWLLAQEQGAYPMTTPDPCASYGGCQYIDACAVPHKLRETILANKYNKHN